MTQEDPNRSAAIEELTSVCILLPTTAYECVQKILQRRGASLDAVILDLLRRNIPAPFMDASRDDVRYQEEVLIEGKTR